MNVFCPSIRYDGLNNGKELLQEEMEEINKIISVEECTFMSRLIVKQQIGSESSFATIWSTLMSISEKHSVRTALKIQENAIIAEEEFKINMILNEGYQYFLKSLFFLQCPVTICGVKSNSYLMGMELAISDLQTMLRKGSTSIVELVGHIGNVIEAVGFMSRNLIYHGDLHLNNIFIVFRDGRERAVVGDFGVSVVSESPTILTSDLLRFFKGILKICVELKEFNSLVDKIERLIFDVTRIDRITAFNYDKYESEEHSKEENVEYIKQIIEENYVKIMNLWSLE